MSTIRTMVDAALSELDADFNTIIFLSGRDSIPPEKLLRAQLLVAFHTFRSERQWMEQIDYNLLFLRFVGFSERARAQWRSWPVWGIFRWKTGMAWSWMPRSRRQRAPLNWPKGAWVCTRCRSHGAFHARGHAPGRHRHAPRRQPVRPGRARCRGAQRPVTALRVLVDVMAQCTACHAGYRLQ